MKFPGKWEFPGGKVEEGETTARTVRREIMEELALAVEVGPLLDVVTCELAGVDYAIHLHECRLEPGYQQPKLVEHDDSAWLYPGELVPERLDWVAHEPRFFPALRREMEHGPAWRQRWGRFRHVMQGRFRVGHSEYGDGVFDRPPDLLAEEISEEAADIAGWGYVLWCRLQNMSRRLLPEGVGALTAAFHRKMGLPIDSVGIRDEARLDFRRELMAEEWKEMHDALYAGDAEAFLDGAADLAFTVAGTCVELGLDYDEAVRRVYESNMTKDPNPSGKAVKGDGFVPVSLGDLVPEHQR